MDIFNVRVGDLVYKKSKYGCAISGLIYKITLKYVYYAICAARADGHGPAYITKDNRLAKTTLYNGLISGQVGISYANGIKRRRLQRAPVKILVTPTDE